MKVAGRWCYLYRAIDRDGQLIDSMLSEQRDKHAARRFLRRLLDVAEQRPLRVTTDRHPAYPRAVRWILGRKVQHRTNQYLNNFMEQDHRAVKQRYYPMRGYPMRGFGSFASASRFCSAFDELRQYFRWRRGRATACLWPSSGGCSRRGGAYALNEQSRRIDRFTASHALRFDRDDVSAVHPPLGVGRLECGVGARTWSDPSFDWRFGYLSFDVSTEPEHRPARTVRANVAYRSLSSRLVPVLSAVPASAATPPQAVPMKG